MGEILVQLICAILVISLYFVLPAIGVFISNRLAHTAPHYNKPYHKMDK